MRLVTLHFGATIPACLDAAGGHWIQIDQRKFVISSASKTSLNGEVDHVMLLRPVLSNLPESQKLRIPAAIDAILTARKTSVDIPELDQC